MTVLLDLIWTRHGLSGSLSSRRVNPNGQKIETHPLTGLCRSVILTASYEFWPIAPKDNTVDFNIISRIRR
jgi:hypothetical protein